MSNPSHPASGRTPDIDPAVQREIDILDTMRSEELQNEFLRRHEHELHSGPNPFLALTGRAAVEGASGAAAALRKARDELLNQAENPRQRQMLTEDLGAHLQVAQDDIARHAARQSLDWQRSVARDRLDLLSRKAGRDLADVSRLQAYGGAAESAGRLLARAAGHAVDSPEADARAAAARSSLFRTALEEGFRRDPQRAMSALNDTVRSWMSPEDAAALDVLMKDPPHSSLPANPEAGASPPPPQATTVSGAPEQVHPLGRGAAPNVEPPPGSPEYESAQRELEAVQDPSSSSVEQRPDHEATPPAEPPPLPPVHQTPGPSQATVAAPAILETGVAGTSIGEITSGIGQVAKGAAEQLKGVAPRFLGSLVRGAPAIGILTTLTNSQAEVRPVGDDARLVIPPGQAGRLQVRTRAGLFGSEIAESWEDVPVAIEQMADADNRPIHTVNPIELANAVGPERAARIVENSELVPFLALSGNKPMIIELRIGVSKDEGTTVELREATTSEVTEQCRNYPVYLRLGEEALEKVRRSGLSGRLAGIRTHKEAKDTLQASIDREFRDELGKELDRNGILRMEPEIALLNGEDKTYSKGHSRLDVLEIFRTGVACAYDYKTGNSTFRPADMRRYAVEVGIFHGRVVGTAMATGRTIFLIPVHLK